MYRKLKKEGRGSSHAKRNHKSIQNLRTNMPNWNEKRSQHQYKIQKNIKNHAKQTRSLFKSKGIPEHSRSAFAAADCILQLANSWSEFWFMRFWLHLTFARFCSYLRVLDVFRYSVSCQAASTFCKCYHRKVTKILENWCQNPSTFTPNPCKIDQNGAQERSESDLGSKSAPGYQKRHFIFLDISGFWCHLGDLGHHLGRNSAPRRSQNQAFWQQESSKVGKITSRKGCWKKLKKYMENW